MSADNQLGKDMLRTPSWCYVEIERTNWNEYPVTVKVDGFSINGSIEVSKVNVPTLLVIPAPEEVGGNQGVIPIVRLYSLAQRLGMTPERLDVRCEVYHSLKERSLLFALLGSTWEKWDQGKNIAGKERKPSVRAKGFAATLENRINLRQDEPIMKITPRIA